MFTHSFRGYPFRCTVYRPYWTRLPSTFQARAVPSNNCSRLLLRACLCVIFLSYSLHLPQLISRQRTAASLFLLLGVCRRLHRSLVIMNERLPGIWYSATKTHGFRLCQHFSAAFAGGGGGGAVWDLSYMGLG